MTESIIPTSTTVGIKSDHQHCVNKMVSDAIVICQQRGVRLTVLRQTVLTLILNSDKPLGAYQLLHALEQQSGKTIAPPTIYRTLDFLIQQGLIHKISSLNAFIGCLYPTHPHVGHFLICESCGTTTEIELPSLTNNLMYCAQQLNFQINKQQTIELSGRCLQCQQA